MEICSLLVFSLTNCPRVTPQQMRSRLQLLRMAAVQMAKPLVAAQIAVHIFKDGRRTRGVVSPVGLSLSHEAASPCSVTMHWPHSFPFKAVGYC